MDALLEPTFENLPFNPRSPVPIPNNDPVDIVMLSQQGSGLQDGLERLGGTDIPGKHHTKSCRYFFPFGRIFSRSDRTVEGLSPVGEIGNPLGICAQRCYRWNKALRLNQDTITALVNEAHQLRDPV